jgi:hypothetical protein
MILRRTEPFDPLCERCVKLTRVTVAAVAFELAPDVRTLMAAGRLPDPKLYSSGLIALCQECANIVDEDGGAIRGCNESGRPLDPTHAYYRIMVISLNDAQLKIVMAAAAQVPYEKRVQFLGRMTTTLVTR